MTITTISRRLRHRQEVVLNLNCQLSTIRTLPPRSDVEKDGKGDHGRLCVSVVKETSSERWDACQDL